ncbi:sulfite exporter TauE/SafE family protein [Pedobacter sandarakinus]|uniref:sulfite exporter TauE/SafE family protein n=1 Tax=Pedobacter sandarakinus TaxID=353156 RepID=UPI002245B372|nr:sulfite exporter TauE/SafE family protein [Pedobacter sandarakinus]MCX2575301.1 sulfite exporter TauE/SafE family protein [Pedobacter sandarakinus]
MQIDLLLFFGLLFIVAFLYSSVGHGGASGYLALMAIFAISPLIMKPTALLLNLFVSSVSFIQFYRGGHFRWKTFWPFAAASIPMSFIGGTMAIESAVYKKILGVLLLIPVIRFFFFKDAGPDERKTPNIPLSLAIGSIIGLLSGMIGIGGGIILSPVLLLLKWTDQKQAAAISAAFIFVNSVAGLGGQLVKGFVFSPDMLTYVGVAFLGGLCGAYFGALKFPQTVLKNVLAVVLALAAYKLLFTHA